MSVVSTHIGASAVYVGGRKSEGAVVEYSRDDPHTDPPKPVELIYKIIMSYHMPIKLLKDPPFPVP